METLILCALSMFIGWRLSSYWSALAFKKLLEELGVSNDQLVKLARKNGIELPEDEAQEDENSDLPVLEVRVEKNDLGLFAYRKDNSLFLAKGADREELMQNLVHNLNNVRVIVRKEDGGDYISP